MDEPYQCFLNLDFKNHLWLLLKIRNSRTPKVLHVSEPGPLCMYLTSEPSAERLNSLISEVLRFYTLEQGKGEWVAESCGFTLSGNRGER